MKMKLGTKLNKQFSKAFKKLRKMSWPKLENVLVICILVFCAFFGWAVRGIGKDIEKVSDSVIVQEKIVINQDLADLVEGSPMEKMVPYLSQKDERVASFLVAIAKKESNWGKFTPKKNGRECYNYWGYRGPENTTISGYSCFKNPRQAVNVVGNRIAKLLEQKIDTPSEMIVWKCGSTCDGHDPGAVNKWISDVDFYYRKIYYN